MNHVKARIAGRLDGRVAVVVYETGDKAGRASEKESADAARTLLWSLGFKQIKRLPNREYWTCGKLRAVIVPASIAKMLSLAQ